MRGSGARWLAALLALVAVSCATATPPATPTNVTWRQPTMPADLWSGAVATQYADAWTAIRRGDLAAGERALTELTRTVRGFYPGHASLGEVALSRHDYRQASASFAAALALSPRYRPALLGAVDAALGAGDDVAAMSALQTALAVEPNQPDARARLDVVRLRVSQRELALAERARTNGQPAEAEQHLARALDATPENGPVLRALAGLEAARGAFDAALGHARQATSLDPQDPAAWVALGDVFSTQGRYREAADAYGRAVAIEPRPDWKERHAAAEERAGASALPEAYRAIGAAASVNRGQVAAVLGVRLAALLSRAPGKSAEVVTDVRGHWAASWILPVVRAGWIDAMPNHTFQAAGAVRRADLARSVAAVLADIAASRGRKVDMFGDAAGHPAFADMSREHAAFRVAALAVTAGIMTVDGNRFQPAAPVSGAELLAVVGRLEARAR